MMIIDGVNVTVSGGGVSDEKLRAYIEYGRKKHGRISEMVVTVDGDFAEIYYTIMPAKFDRIRRITGYLVGTLDRFNSAKRAEVNERVKHGM